ncbi:MAG: ABC transporter permease [Wujia sp.]
MLENIRLSFQGIWAHKMRSFLTMLGIIIGIAAIIAIVSTIRGTNEQIKENLVGSGNNIVNIKLSQGEWQYTSGDSMVPKNVPQITEDIKKEILEVASIEAVSAYRYGALYEGVVCQDQSMENAPIYGVDPDYLKLMGYTVQNGRWLLPQDWNTFHKCVVLDSTAANTLCPGSNPIGMTVEIKGEPFTVVGVVEQLDDFAPTVNSINDWYTYYGESVSGKLFIPDVNWPLIYNFDEPYHVVVKPKSTDDMTDAGKKAADILNSHIQGANSTNGPQTQTADSEQSEEETSTFKYRSEDLLEKAKAMQEISNSTSQQLIWIASISLLVGGIGVMNIMLVSVTERTREIGLKKALGAKKSVILAQFLTEAAVLTSLGGILGVAGGIGLAYLIADVASVPVAISGAAITVSVAFSMILGIVFGFIPSVKAANLNPIDALRYE